MKSQFQHRVQKSAADWDTEEGASILSDLNKQTNQHKDKNKWQRKQQRFVLQDIGRAELEAEQPTSQHKANIVPLSANVQNDNSKRSKEK